MSDSYIKSGRVYDHQKYGRVKVIRACTLVHFDCLDGGPRRGELTDLFIGNTEPMEDEGW